MIYGQAFKLADMQRYGAIETHINERRASIATFVSGKGGTGKSALSLNLATILAQQGKKVLLADLDANFANIGIMLNVYADHTLNEFFSHRVLLDEVVYNYSKNLHLLLGEVGADNYTRSDVNDIKMFFGRLERLADDYDYILIDTSSGISDHILEVVASSDLCFIVANPEPTAIMDAYAVLKYFRAGNVYTPHKVILNKCRSEASGKESFDKLNKATEHFLGERLELCAIINSSEDVRTAAEKQEPLLKIIPQSEVLTQMKKIVMEVEKIRQLANNSHRR